MTKYSRFIFTISIFFLLVLTGCQQTWQIEVQVNDTAHDVIEQEIVSFYLDELDYEKESILLAQIFYHQGFTLIDNIRIEDNHGQTHIYDWEQIAETSRIFPNGDILINQKTYETQIIHIEPSTLANEIKYSITDIAPTIANILNLPPLTEATGNPIYDGSANHVAMILIDGLQYNKLIELISLNKIPFFSTIDQIKQGLTVFPSITTASTTALLTGAPPQINHVYGYGYRSTDSDTLFDLAVDNGKAVTAVEGYSLAFNLHNAKVILSGDRDGDGFTDDNVLKNSLNTIESDMPDVLFIHFHDVDDLGHRFGPDSEEYTHAIIKIDDYLSQIFDSLPESTHIIIFADHGMQDDSFSAGGNHGMLTQKAMIIPILLLEK